MNKLVLVVFLIFSSNSYSVDIAQCSNPSGRAYYPEIGLVNKSNSGWDNNEKITSGLTKLIKTDKDKFDIIFVDARKKIISTVEDGGQILKLNRGKDLISFLVIYPQGTVEILTFLINKSGKAEYMDVLSRGGDGVFITKGSVMRGDCDYINFKNIDD